MFKDIYKKWWFYIILFIVISSVVVFIVLINKNDNNKSSNNKFDNPKLDIYEIDEEIYVIEENEEEIENVEDDNDEDIEENEYTNQNNNSNNYNDSNFINDNSSNSSISNNTNNNNTSSNNSSSNNNNNNSSNNSNSNNNNNNNKTIEATKEYYCIGNYKLEGKECVYSYSSSALINYTCNKGTLNGSKCNYTSTTKTPLNPYSSVPGCSGLTGYQYCSCAGGVYENNTCYVYKETTITENAIANYYCPDSYTLVGDQCVLYSRTDAPFKLVCPAGYTLIGIECKKN